MHAEQEFLNQELHIKTTSCFNTKKRKMNRTETISFSTEMCELQGEKKSQDDFFIRVLLNLQEKKKKPKSIPLGSP